MRTMPLAVSAFALALTSSLLAAPDSTSLMSQAYQTDVERATISRKRPHALRAVSLFALEPEEPRQFVRHDLVQIIVREMSTSKSSQELETSKENVIEGGIDAWPDMRLSDLLQLQVMAGRTTNLPSVDLDFNKEFEGEGEYEREDEMTGRLTAEVIEILPNGNLVLEASTHVRSDEEEATMKVTGICRPEDVTPANTILSNQLHDLSIEKMHKGELKKANEKGVIAKVLDAVFAF